MRCCSTFTYVHRTVLGHIHHYLSLSYVDITHKNKGQIVFTDYKFPDFCTIGGKIKYTKLTKSKGYVGWFKFDKTQLVAFCFMYMKKNTAILNNRYFLNDYFPLVSAFHLATKLPERRVSIHCLYFLTSHSSTHDGFASSLTFSRIASRNLHLLGILVI